MSRLSRLFLFVAGSAIAAIVPLTNTAEAASLITCDQPVFINQIVSSDLTLNCTARVETTPTSVGLFSTLVNGEFKLISATTTPPSTASCSRRLNVLMCNGRETYIVTMKLGLKTSSICGTKVAVSGVVGSTTRKQWLTANVVFPPCKFKSSSSSSSAYSSSSSSSSSITSSSSSSSSSSIAAASSSSASSTASSVSSSSSSKSSSSAANTPPTGSTPEQTVPLGSYMYKLRSVFSQNNANASNQQTRRNINCPAGYVVTRVGYKDFGTTDAMSGIKLECRKLNIDSTLGITTGFMDNEDVDLVSGSFGYSPCAEGQILIGVALKKVNNSNAMDGISAGCSSIHQGGDTFLEASSVTNTDISTNGNPSLLQICPNGSYLTGLGYSWLSGTQTVSAVTYINCAPIQLKRVTQCNDGVDNDNDGKVDMSDSGCLNDEDNIE